MNWSVRPLSRGFSKNRIEALIDGIFAVAMTLLVLGIKLPEGLSYATNDELWARLKSLERHFVIYVISFVVIAICWVAHHVQFHYVRYTDRRLIWINMAFLLLISFLPFATDLVGDNENLVLPCLIYGVTLLALSAVSSIHLRYLEWHPYLASPEFTPLAAKLLRRRIALFAIVPGLSMLVAFYSPRLALYVYLLLAGAHFVPGRIDEHIVAPPASAESPNQDSEPNNSLTGQ
jgi:TMEM175 potassium channel family protein